MIRLQRGKAMILKRDTILGIQQVEQNATPQTNLDLFNFDLYMYEKFQSYIHLKWVNTKWNTL